MENGGTEIGSATDIDYSHLVDFSPDGTQLVLGWYNNTVKSWNVEKSGTLILIHILQGHNNYF